MEGWIDMNNSGHVIGQNINNWALAVCGCR